MADTTERANSVFITGLKNAHALENQALELMNRQVERIENYADIKARLQQHIQETHEQIARLERILESLGESRSVLKDNALSLIGNMAAITHAFTQDEIIKNSMATWRRDSHPWAARRRPEGRALSMNSGALAPGGSYRHDMLVNVFFLGVVKPDQRLDQLNDTLRVADEVAVSVLGAKPSRKAKQQPRQMLNFPVGAAHRGKSGRIGQLLRQPGIKRRLVLPLMFDDLFLNDCIGFCHERHCALRSRIVERIGNLTKAVEALLQRPMILQERFGRPAPGLSEPTVCPTKAPLKHSESQGRRSLPGRPPPPPG